MQSLTEEQKARIRLLVDDLRTTSIKQGQNRLRTIAGGETFDCCLGRACDIFIRETGKGEWVRDSAASANFQFNKNHRSSTNLTIPVADWYGFEHYSPMVYYDGEPTSAMNMNDAGYTFAQIADAFEETYLSEKE